MKALAGLPLVEAAKPPRMRPPATTRSTTQLRTLLGLVYGLGTATTAATAAAPLPKPTAEQLAWQEMEIGALIHFNMATYAPAGTRPGGVCSPDASTFNPALLDTDQWAEVYTALGAKGAVLTAKHGCGHLLWPTNVTLLAGEEYSYAVG